MEVAAGISSQPRNHFRRPVELPFTRDQRKTTTILLGGLTWKHDHLIEGALRGLGYTCKALPNPDLESYEIGREYQNNGYCNPSYFTIGNLIKYLQHLEDRGMSRQDILDKHVLLTVGTCGPCRFGLYESEYRLALQNAGFDGFRVITFSLTGGLDQSGVQPGMEMNLDFFLQLINSLMIGDILNQFSYQIRPYELEPGSTDRLLEEVIDRLCRDFTNKQESEPPTVWKKLLMNGNRKSGTQTLGKYLHQLTSDYFVEALNRSQKRLDTIELDRFRVRPLVKIVGEFWSALAEGDGNFNMFRFLEEEGAEVHVDQFIGSHILHTLHLIKGLDRDKKGVYEWREIPPLWRLDRRFRELLHYWKKAGVLALAERLYRRESIRFQRAVGSTSDGLHDMDDLAQLALPFYNWRCGSGEDHLEVAKNIYYHQKHLCHMVLSLKPFGCMPSTQSDGAQALVVEQYKNMIFLSIETAGEGEILAHSRVQMVLSTARQKARREFQRALAATGRSLDELKGYVREHPELNRPTYPVPHHPGVVGTAANFALHVADLMG